MEYADPSRCPGCREHLPHGASRCPHCDLAVRHPLAQQVFASLARADELIARLRAEAPAATAPSPTFAPAPIGEPGTIPPPPAPVVAPAAPARRMSVVSIPKVLLGLGALCLLVAAVIFLAVSWSWLGVGGRTAVLLALTAGAGAVAVVLHRFELRIAAEALATVCLGLVALDVAGAESAGWLGTPSESTLAIVLGLVVAAAGTAFAYLTRPHLGAPQVAAGLGLLVAYAGTLASTPHDLVAGHLALGAVAAAVAVVHRAGLRIAALAFAVVGALAWSVTLLIALEALSTGPVTGGGPTLRGLWLTDGTGWSLVVSAIALVVPGIVLRREQFAIRGGAIATLLVTIALTAPVIDESARSFAVVALVATASWLAATTVLPTTLRVLALVPAASGALLLAGLVLLTGAVAAVRWTGLGEPFGAAPDVRFGGQDPVTEPLAAAPAVVVVVAVLAATRLFRGSSSTWLAHGGVATGVAALATLASYDVRLAVVSAAGGLLTLAALGLSLAATADRDRTGHGIQALALAASGGLVALPSATLTSIVATGALGVAAALHIASPVRPVRALAGLALAPAAALALAGGAAAYDVDPARVGIPILVVVGLLAIARPRPEVEVPACLMGLLALVVAVPHAVDVGGSLALHVAVAGGLVAVTALVHDSRRQAIWAALALLLLASWIRLGDLGVSAPEPYTLPLALAVTGAGLWRLRRDPRAGTPLTLLPGLGLATVPSLLWVLDDPASLRALLLGAACVALAIGGAVLRWSAPLLTGATVGTVLVLRELGPYAATVPQWVWIGLAGTVLTVVGVTWERRLQEVRTIAGRLGNLR